MVAVTIRGPLVAPVAGGGPTTIRFTPGTSEKPVTETPGGLRPKSPVITLAPVFVTVVAPRTAKVCEEASAGAVCAHARLPPLNMQITNKTFFISKLLGWISLQCR